MISVTLRALVIARNTISGPKGFSIAYTTQANAPLGAKLTTLDQLLNKRIRIIVSEIENLRELVNRAPCKVEKIIERGYKFVIDDEENKDSEWWENASLLGDFVDKEVDATFQEMEN